MPAPSPPSTWPSHFVDVKDFGAVGDCNTATGAGTDNTLAIQAAINSTAVGQINAGKMVFLSGGRFKTTGPLVLKEGTSLVGASMLRGHASTFLPSIEFYGGPTDNAIQAIGTSAQSVSRVAVERFRINDHRTSPTSGDGVNYQKCVNQTVVRNMDIIGFPSGASVRITSDSSGGASDCVVVDDIWANGSRYGVYLHNIDNNCLVRDIKMDSFSTDPLISMVYVNGTNGVIMIYGLKHENRKATANSVQLEGNFGGVQIDGIVSRTGTGGAVVNMINPAGSGSAITIRNLIRDFTGDLLAITGRPTITGTRLEHWVGGSDGYNVNGARVASSTATGVSWDRLNLEGSILVALTGGRVGFYGTNPIPKPALTYSRATETAASTQLRTTLVALGLVTDSTQP